MLQGRLVSTDILFQLKNPILVNVHEQDITRKKNTYRSGGFFLFRTICPQLMQKVLCFKKPTPKLYFFEMIHLVVPLQGSQRRLAVVHGI